jgi:cardiolipin synthase A/B
MKNWKGKILNKPLFKKVVSRPIWKRYSRAEWTILIVGILAILVLITSLFTSFGDKTPPPSLSIPENIPIDDPRFENAVEGIVHGEFENGGPVTILTNGHEFLPDLLNEIRNASSSINITNYIWDGGEFGNTLLTALIEKARQGVEVRILLDGLGGRKADVELIEELEKAGGKVAIFRDITPGQLTRIHRRTHVRAFIIDGQTAYTGGIAISDKWLGDATSTKSWHDFMFKMEGNMAESTQKVFAFMWAQTTGEILAGPKIFPEQSEGTLSRANEGTSTSRYISLFSSPAPDMSQGMEHFLWISIQGAKESIHIENPYLVLSDPLMDIIKEKARQGVNIEIILPGKHTDQKVVQWTSQSYYSELIEAGIKIYEYEPSRIHAKFILIDGRWSIIGSANLDNRSRELNVESILGIDDPVFGQELDAAFAEDKNRSKEITMEEWKKRSKIVVPLGLLSRFFVKQY